MKKIVEESMKDAKGTVSSTRIKSWYMMKYFMILVPLLIILMFAGAWIIKVTPTDSTSYFIVIGGFNLSLVMLLLTAIFVPTQLNKRTETNGIVELAKILKVDPIKETPDE